MKIVLECCEIKIIIFLDLQKIMCDFIIDPKFFQIGEVNDFDFARYIPLHFPGNIEEKSAIIKDIDTDPNLYKKVVELWKREKEKESVIKSYEKIKGIVLDFLHKK
jgi:hypothetical protein